MPGVAAKLEYTRADALRMTGVTERQLKSWEKAGLLDALDPYTFSKLVALRTLARLKKDQVPTSKIRRAVEAVRQKMREVENPLTELRIYSDGSRIRVRVGRQEMEPESGQLLLDFGEGELERMVSLPERKGEENAAASRRKQQEAENWFQRGVELEQTGAPVEQAVDAYKLAIALDPQLAAALVNLGTIYFTSQEFDKADKYYSRALEANPKYPLANFNMGNLHDERGDRAKALVHYLTALRLDPNYADAHYNVALVYQAAGQTMKAMRHWRTYVKLDPTSAWADIARRELGKLVDSAVVRGKGAPA